MQSILSARASKRLEDPALICAAVLIPLLVKDGEWHVLVTRRGYATAYFVPESYTFWSGKSCACMP